MNILTNILNEIWLVTVAMAPYLLFGFLMAGILSVLISKTYVRQHLGGKGWQGSLKAALMGVPMPICSCGVIPLAASLRKHGASRGATAAFLASTPQTGVDSLMVTYALLGGVFAVFRAGVAFLSGVICGTAVSLASSKEPEEPANDPDECDQLNEQNRIKRMLTYGFITLPKAISRAMIIGIILSGILSGIIPEHFFTDYLGNSPWAMLVMLAIGIPLYVCSSASVPIALAFIKAGISPGAALVFLIVGPATNAATLTTLWNIIGKKQLVVFLATLSTCALTAGFIMNLFNPTFEIAACACLDCSCDGALDYLWAALLILLLIKGMIPERKKKTTTHS